MKLIMTLIVGLLVTLVVSSVYAVDLEKLEKDLASTGVVGHIHASVSDRNLMVFTYRNPDDFFDNVQLPMTSSNADTLALLLKSKRHQKVRLYGGFITHGAPLKHIDVSKIELVADHQSELDQKPYTYKATDSEFHKYTELIGRVHAIDQGGKVLVIEYKDLVTPVFVSRDIDIAVVKGLYRGDKIKLEYEVRDYPGSPLHLSPKEVQADKPALKVIEKIVDVHEKKLNVEGYLVKFPKSPQISFDVYAVLKEDEEGANIQFTLMNFTDNQVFTQLREKLDKIWKSSTDKIENGRNKLINRGVKIKATGLGNVVSQSQANPQIIIDAVADVSVISK